MIEQYIQALTELTVVKKPDFGNGTFVLSLLYEAYSELNLMDTEQIKATFKTLYHTMNGKSLEEMDVILYPVIHNRRLSAYTDEPAVVHFIHQNRQRSGRSNRNQLPLGHQGSSRGRSRCRSARTEHRCFQLKWYGASSWS